MLSYPLILAFFIHYKLPQLFVPQMWNILPQMNVEQASQIHFHFTSGCAAAAS